MEHYQGFVGIAIAAQSFTAAWSTGGALPAEFER
jgi:hypothetical protein